VKLPNLSENFLCTHSLVRSIAFQMRSASATLREVARFARNVPCEEAFTAPASWYTMKEFHDLDGSAVFFKNWLVIGDTIRMSQPGNYMTGEFMGKPWLLSCDEDRNIRGFYNVCSHHAMCVAEGAGTQKNFVCPYHGWTYNLKGQLIKTVAMKGIKKFKPKQNGLKPLRICVQEPFILADFSQEGDLPEIDLSHLFGQLNVSNLAFVKSRTYDLKCNWKVFVDNYCDGGYHVPFKHKDLAAGVNFDSYQTELFDRYSVQCVSGNNEDARLGSRALYSFVYPNMMINRYGPWMDTNFVIPTSHNSCQVVFHWFADRDLHKQPEIIEDSINQSNKVQIEDEELCHGVQIGLQSGAYESGRYVPKYETPMHHFHSLLFDDYMSFENSRLNGNSDLLDATKSGLTDVNIENGKRLASA